MFTKFCIFFADCENLIRRMLVVNPKKRLTITQIKKHKWLESVVVVSKKLFQISHCRM